MSSPGTLYIVSAPSGAGKTSLIEALLASRQGEGLGVSISHTTRPKRAGEAHNKHYHFCDRQTFQRLIEEDAFLEWAEVFGHLYGTSEELLQQTRTTTRGVILEIDYQGALQIMKKISAVSIFILPPSLEVLETRLQERGKDDAASIQHRLSKARQEIAYHQHYDFCIVNDEFAKALEDLTGIFATGKFAQERDARALAVELAESQKN